MTNQIITIVDYGMGNIRSIEKGFEKVGVKTEVSGDPEKIIHADKIVIPGVGAFNRGMEFLEKNSLDKVIKEFIKNGRYVLGICLGMQLLMEESEEIIRTNGLGVLKGKVIKIPEKTGEEDLRKIPHIGWNKIKINRKNEKSILSNIDQGEFFYFVHSFMCQLDNNEQIIASVDYNGCIINAAIQNDNIIGLQFHPEKSSMKGLNILKNFSAI